MGVNKVNLADGETLIDLTSDTVSPSTLVKGFTAHNSKGERIVGNLNPEGGTGSGIIDVTELPTVGIDENAVYRLTENIQLEKTEVYLRVHLNGQTMTITLQQYISSLGVPTIANIYVVDELSNMLETDIQGFSVVNVYIKRSDGIAYVYSPYIPINNGIITIGYLAFTSQGYGEGYDKGVTEDINAETNLGIYTTIEAFKEVVRYFIRESGEWKEITAYTTFAKHGFANVEVLSGDITQITYGASDILSRECTEINEEWFRKRDGTYLDIIKAHMFYSSLLESATIPNFISEIESQAFAKSYSLEVVTFKGVPKWFDLSTFYDCYSLNTINVPWAEGEVACAPWGATNATINYNYTEG